MHSSLYICTHKLDDGSVMDMTRLTFHRQQTGQTGRIVLLLAGSLSLLLNIIFEKKEGKFVFGTDYYTAPCGHVCMKFL